MAIPRVIKNIVRAVMLTDSDGSPISGSNPMPITGSLSSGATGSDGELLDLDSLAQTLDYNGDGTLNYVEVTQSAKTYRQTMGYSGGNLVSVSAWVKQ